MQSSISTSLMFATRCSKTHEAKFPTQPVPVARECWAGLVLVAFKKSIDVIVRCDGSWMAKWEFHAAQ